MKIDNRLSSITQSPVFIFPLKIDGEKLTKANNRKFEYYYPKKLKRGNEK